MITKAAFGHFGISLVKSILRIVGCVFVIQHGNVDQFRLNIFTITGKRIFCIQHKSIHLFKIL